MNDRHPVRRPPHLVVGSHPVLDALRDGIPVDAVLVAEEGGRRGAAAEERGRRGPAAEVLRVAHDRGIPVRHVPRSLLDEWSEGAVHQGVALAVPAYRYRELADLLGATNADREAAAPREHLLVALDGITDPRNLGAIVRSAAAFHASGVVIPQRRAAGMTPAAWKASAGAAARVPVARVVNLPRALREVQDAGLQTLGLAVGGSTDIWDLPDYILTGPVCLVVGSEGGGLGQLVSRTCDWLVSIPMAGGTESLNASVAAGVALADVARRRRTVARPE